jgi:hypothetical protein
MSCNKSVNLCVTNEQRDRHITNHNTVDVWLIAETEKCHSVDGILTVWQTFVG